MVYVALLMSYTWQVLAATSILYLCTLPFGARAWTKKYGSLPAHETDVEEGVVPDVPPGRVGDSDGDASRH